MDMNLPEGFLLSRIRERAPKTPPTKMQLLALMGHNGIGWLEYAGSSHAKAGKPISRRRLLADGVGKGSKTFNQLVDAYLEKSIAAILKGARSRFRGCAGTSCLARTAAPARAR